MTKTTENFFYETNLWKTITNERLDENQTKWQILKQITTQKAKTLYLNLTNQAMKRKPIFFNSWENGKCQKHHKDLKGTSTTIETTLKLKTEIETLRA